MIRTLARGLHEGIVEFALGANHAVHEEVEAAELAIHPAATSALLIARTSPANQRLIESRGELADVLFEPLARVSQRARPARRGLGNRPRNRSLVGHANDEAVFACEDGHLSGRWSLISGRCR